MCHKGLLKNLILKVQNYTAQKMKFSIMDLFSKYDQIRSFQRIWSRLLKKSLMENFIFCAVLILTKTIILFRVLCIRNSFYYKLCKRRFSQFAADVPHPSTPAVVIS